MCKAGADVVATDFSEVFIEKAKQRSKGLLNVSFKSDFNFSTTTEGRLRWYLPRETDIAKITQEELDQLAAKMNWCPRKCLGYKTPQEVFIQQHKNDCRIWS